MWSTNAQRWALGVLATVLLLAALTAATGRDGDQLDAARFVDAAIDAPQGASPAIASRLYGAAVANDPPSDRLGVDGPRSVSEFAGWVESVRVQDSDAPTRCLHKVSNFVTGLPADAHLSVGDRMPDGVEAALSLDHRALEDYEIRTLIHPAGDIALTSLDVASLSGLPIRPSDQDFAAGYVELIYVQVSDGPEWAVLEAALVGACPER